jgi:predicted DNA-binding transcriptional regulator AlpA
MEGAEHLAGPAEIAEALGVDANTVNQWKVRYTDFPRPVRILKAGSVWDLRDVLEWAQRTGRNPGGHP